jgi:hypothetical protein
MSLKDEIYETVLSAGSDDLNWFGGRYEGGVYLQQSPGEFSSLILFLLDKNIKNYLEIGAASGGCVYLMDKFLDLDEIYLIDEKYKEFVGNSHSKEAHRFVDDSGLSFDLIMVDGDHSYEGVKQDTIDYLIPLKWGGYMIFHDIITQRVGVKDWIKELEESKIRLNHVVSFVDKSKQLGIGVFQKNENTGT